MKAAIVIVGAAVGAALVYAASTTKTAAVQPDAQQEIDQNDALAYGVGYFLGGEVRGGLEADGIDADLERLAQGFIDGLQERGSAYDPDTLDAILEAVHEEMMARRAAKLLESDPMFKALADDNAAKSAAYMNAYAQRDGVSELFDGVLYEVVKSGKGASASEATNVVLTFEASRIDGHVFLAGKKSEVDLTQVRDTARRIAQSMKVGDHWRVSVSPEQAFGVAGLLPNVGPNEVVVLDVELVEVK